MVETVWQSRVSLIMVETVWWNRACHFLLA